MGQVLKTVLALSLILFVIGWLILVLT